MNEERLRILKMVEEKKITADEAAKLLFAIDENAAPRPSASAEKQRHPEPEPPSAPSGRKKFLHIKVDSNRGDNVDVRVPIKLIKAGMAFSSMVPGLEKSLKSNGVEFDLNSLRGKSADEIVEALEELCVKVNGRHGEIVTITCE
jgi:hypothetical protein